MVWSKVYAYAGSIFVAVAALLLWADPVAAQTPTITPTVTSTPLPTATPYYTGGAYEEYEPDPTPIPTLPNYGIWQNSPEIEVSIQLLMPLPTQPDTSGLFAVMPELSLPELELPEINPSADWPSLTMGREGILAQVESQLFTVRDAARAQYNAAYSEIAEVGETIQSMRDFVGSPQANVIASDGARQVTVVGMAQEMAQSVEFALSYLRALGSLGPFGLDIVFVFIGLGWILFLNLLEWIMLAIAWVVKRIVGVLEFVITIVRVLLEIVRTIMALIPFF